MNTFIEQLKRAFALWWRVKILWPLGMLAALVGYGDTALNSNFNVSQSVPSDPESEMPEWLLDAVENPMVRDFIDNPLPYIFGLIAIIIVLGLIFALVGALAHGALIRVADVADQGYTASLGEGLRVGAGRMVPIFLLNLALALPVILIVAGVFGFMVFAIIAAVAAGDSGAGVDSPGQLIASVLGAIFCALGIILLSIVIGALLGVWSRVAQRVCVIEARGPIASLGRAWGLIRRNLGLTIITWFFQAILGSIIGVLLAIPAVAIAFPALISIAQGGALPIGLLIGLFLYALLANTLVGGLLTAFNSALWTLVYRAFVAREEPVGYASYGPA